MKYLLDTDHLTVFQRQTGSSYQNLAIRMAAHAPEDFVIPIVTVHEQFLGIHAYLNQTKRLAEIVIGYEMLSRVLKDYLFFSVVDFDVQASQNFEWLAQQKIRLGVMDARIAAIALAQDLTLLTRNQKDFTKVSELRIQDWTVATG